jgi:hypothetical protein
MTAAAAAQLSLHHPSLHHLSLHDPDRARACVLEALP